MLYDSDASGDFEKVVEGEGENAEADGDVRVGVVGEVGERIEKISENLYANLDDSGGRDEKEDEDIEVREESKKKDEKEFEIEKKVEKKTRNINQNHTINVKSSSFTNSSTSKNQKSNEDKSTHEEKFHQMQSHTIRKDRGSFLEEIRQKRLTSSPSLSIRWKELTKLLFTSSLNTSYDDSQIRPLHSLWRCFRMEIDVKSRRYLFEWYPDVFVSSEAITWMTEKV
jgi:hypothetical protein